jgi:hypothetical protein
MNEGHFIGGGEGAGFLRGWEALVLGNVLGRMRGKEPGGGKRTPSLRRGVSISLKGLSAHCLTGFDGFPPILKA